MTIYFKEGDAVNLSGILKRLEEPKTVPFFVFISGHTYSGKNFLAEQLLQVLKEDCLILDLDNYFKNHNDPTIPFYKGYPSFDQPNSYKNDLIKQHILNLSVGKPVLSPIYDLTINRQIGEKVIYPQKTILVLSLFAQLVSYAISNPLQKYKVFIFSDKKIRLERRIQRDIIKYQISSNRVQQIFEEYVEPLEFLISDFQMEADLVIEN